MVPWMVLTRLEMLGMGGACQAAALPVLGLIAAFQGEFSRSEDRSIRSFWHSPMDLITAVTDSATDLGIQGLSVTFLIQVIGIGTPFGRQLVSLTLVDDSKLAFVLEGLALEEGPLSNWWAGLLDMLYEPVVHVL
jgi:hypothetical protein